MKKSDSIMFQAKRQMAIDLQSVDNNITQREDDKKFIKAMGSKDKTKAQDAFNQLYKRYHSAIYYKILRMVKMNRETAKDLTQEVFVKLHQKYNLYDESTAVSTWLYSIAQNHVIDHKRREKYEVFSLDTLKSEFGGDENMGEVAFQVEDKSTDTFKQVIKNERAAIVLDAVNNGITNKDAKQIITLLFIEDLPYDEVSEKVQMPLGTVKALMFRAKREMKEYLSKKSLDFSY